MKYSFAAVLLGSASAEWDQWQADYYCDFNQKEVDLYNSYDATYTVDQCTSKCQQMDEEATYPIGTPMCCDYANYSDGSFQCILYTGQTVVDVNKDDFPDDNFLAFTFTHGEYQGSAPPSTDDDDNDRQPTRPDQGPEMQDEEERMMMEEPEASKILTLSMSILTAGYMTII